VSVSSTGHMFLAVNGYGRFRERSTLLVRNLVPLICESARAQKAQLESVWTLLRSQDDRSEAVSISELKLTPLLNRKPTQSQHPSLQRLAGSCAERIRHY
jgi:hypothetical protein